MSFDIIISRYRDGALAPLPPWVIDALFQPFVIYDDEAFIRVRYPGNDGGADIWGTKKPEILSLMFNHAGGPQFFDALYHLLKETKSVIYWPMGRPVVADMTVAAHMPADMIKALGMPELVASGADIYACILKT